MELKVFDQRARFESEVYIGDYTEYVKTHEDYTIPCTYPCLA